MSVASVRTPADYEERLARYLFERSEEGRAVRVGEKEVSEQAAIVERFRDLFSTAQVDVLRAAEESASGDERELLYRLRKTCESGIIAAELAAREDELENRILAARVDWRGEELPLRNAQAKLAVLTGYGDRDELGSLANAVSAGFNDDRRELLAAGEALEAELSGEPDPVARNGEEKGISLEELERVLDAASRASAAAYDGLRDRWFEKLLGPEREEFPTSNHTSYLRRLSPFDQTYTKEQAVPVCVASLAALGLDMAAMPGIRLDLDDRPQKSPRACVIASDPPNVVHLITRAQGGLHDYQAFLHEAGHALHYAGVDPELPYTFRKLSRDHALTEIYSYIVEAISREPGWHAEHFGLSDEQAAGECRGDGLPRGAALPPLHGEAPVRARVLGPFRRGRRHRGRLLRAAHGRHRHPLSGRELPVRHGLRLLLRRLPSCLDPLGAAAAASRPRGGRGLVAQPGDRRSPARALPRGHASDERGDRSANRLRAARHCASLARARRLVRLCQSALTPSARRRTVHLNRVSGLGAGHAFLLTEVREMHVRRWKSVATLAAATTVLAVFASGAQARPESSTGTSAEAAYKVGIVYSRTGLLAAYGAEYIQGLRYGLAYATKGTMKVNGRSIELTVVDDGTDPTKAVAAGKDLIGKGYKILAGSVSSGVALQMAPLAEQNKVLFISGPAASDAVTGDQQVHLPLRPPDLPGREDRGDVPQGRRQEGHRLRAGLGVRASATTRPSTRSSARRVTTSAGCWCRSRRRTSRRSHSR